MSGGHDPGDNSRDRRRIEWTARVVRRLGDTLGGLEDCRTAGSVAMVSRALLTMAARLQADGEESCGAAGPLPLLLDELIAAYARLGGEIVRHAMAAALAVDRFKAGNAR